MPFYPRKKTTTHKKRPYTKRRNTYKKKSTYKSKKNAFNKTNDMYVPKKKLCTLIKHSLPGADITNLSVLNDNLYAWKSSDFDTQYKTLTQYDNLNTTMGGTDGSVELETAYNIKFSKFKSFYEKCCIIGTKITVQYTNTGTTPIKIICGINDNSITKIGSSVVGVNLYNRYQNVKGHKTFSLLPDTARMQYKVSFKCNPNKLTGLYHPLSDSTPIEVVDATEARQGAAYYLNRPYRLNYKNENINPDNLVHYYHSAVDMTTGAFTTAFKVDYVLENTYIFTDTKDNGLNIA